MATTEHPEWADRMRLMSLHGISKDAWKRYSAEGSWYYEILSPGYKYNLTDIAAAIGIEQLKKCDSFWVQRQLYATMYHKGFREVRGVCVPPPAEVGQHAWHLYVIQLDCDRLTIDRSQFIELLREHHIGTSVHFIPLHLHPYYREMFRYRREDFPHASAAYERIVSLPIYPRLTSSDVQRVIGVVSDIVKRHQR